MRTILPLLFAVLVMSGCQTSTPPTTDPLVSALDSAFHDVTDFSGVVLVADSTGVVYHQAFGYRDWRLKTPMDTTAIFELAPVSKQFTAMVIMMLKAEGRLEYDDPVEKYIPGLPYKDITIRHLLTHTSGLPDYQAVMDQYWDKTRVAGNEDNIAYLIKYHPAELFAPGDKYNYSNTGYMLLASIASAASGEDFIDLCRERIFQPLHMTDTDIRTQAERLTLERMAWGHLFVKEKSRYVQADSFPQFNYSIWLGNRKGPGRISSTTSDLFKWDRALYDRNLVPEREMKEAFSPMTLNNDSVSRYGFGWTLEKHPIAGEVVRHSGSNPGYNTHIVRYIAKRRTIILLCNNAHRKFGTILGRLEDIVAAR